MFIPAPDRANLSICIRDSYASSKMANRREWKVHTSNVQHRSYILHPLVQWVNEVGRCAIERKFGGGDDVCADFVLEPTNSDTITRARC